MATITDSARPRAVNRNQFENLSWLFMRLSALALIILALGHLLVQHILGSVYTLSLSTVATRWASLGWRIFDWLLLILALSHGLNGLRYLTDDYILSPGANRAIKVLIVIVGAFLIVIGSVTIIGGVRMF